jgi:LuxR family maltose regulon positive regulatory protein
MSMPLLATKLYMPGARPQMVLRPRLSERLTSGLYRKLTLISAPAGFGKTSLVSAWLAECGRRVSWLSLDAGENDPDRFLAYLVAALQTISPNIGAGVLQALRSPRPAPSEALLTTMLNELGSLPYPFVIVLDDYHMIESAAVEQAVRYLVEHLPSQMHLVIATREDPELPLAWLRAQGQLTELRAADLRFTPAEAAEFLTQSMNLSLSADDITAIEGRTEGWIAGLQLAALSLQGQQLS